MKIADGKKPETGRKRQQRKVAEAIALLGTDCGFEAAVKTLHSLCHELGPDSYEDALTNAEKKYRSDAVDQGA